MWDVPGIKAFLEESSSTGLFVVLWLFFFFYPFPFPSSLTIFS